MSGEKTCPTCQAVMRHEHHLIMEIGPVRDVYQQYYCRTCNTKILIEDVSIEAVLLAYGRSHGLS